MMQLFVFKYATVSEGAEGCCCVSMVRRREADVSAATEEALM